MIPGPLVTLKSAQRTERAASVKIISDGYGGGYCGYGGYGGGERRQT